jgi:hypothetical protein
MEGLRLDDDRFEHRITLIFCEEFNMHYQLTAFASCRKRLVFSSAASITYQKSGEI